MASWRSARLWGFNFALWTTIVATAEDIKPLPSLAYVKIPRTGSSTFAGVLLRIADKRGLAHARDAKWLEGQGRLELNKTSSILVNFHIRQYIQPLAEKFMLRPLYIASVREPRSLCMSAFYSFVATRGRVDPTDTRRKVLWIRGNSYCGAYQYNQLKQFDDQTSIAVFNAYDFVMVTERFDESLLVLKRVLKEGGLAVSVSDLLYVRAKESGGVASDKRDKRFMAKHPDISSEPHEVRDALERRTARGEDTEIVAMANRRLDKARIPRKELAAFHQRQLVVAEHCSEFAGRDCLHRESESGCGQECIDSIASQNNWD